MRTLLEASYRLNELDGVCKKVISFKPLVICLEGDLGAGKTQFVRSFCQTLGLNDLVQSPSFSLLNIYSSEHLTVHHLDLYRISNPLEIEELDWDYILEADYVCIEWPDQVLSLFEESEIPYFILRIKHIEGHSDKRIYKLITSTE